MSREYDSEMSGHPRAEVQALPNSPAQEHHIDFLLEEEFACNPGFLGFFVKAAEECFKPLSNEVEGLMLIQPRAEWDCKAIRSVTTDKGETDVLAIYSSARRPNRVALLIENKIRAGFQQDQAERYRERGEAGKKAKQWDFYWTCLISPDRYAPDNMGFDTRVSLEKLAKFFSGEVGRSRFKSGVIERALKRFAETGLQIKDEAMTQFRAFYAQEAASFFANGEVSWPKARDAWWGDTWFNFRGGGMPLGAEIVYKSERGFIDLAFSKTKVEVLERALAKCSNSLEIHAEKTGKSASFRVSIKPISDFKDPHAAKPVVLESFQRVRDLIAFYKSNKELITDEMTPLASGPGS